MKTIIDLVAFFALLAPLVWELIDDRKGDDGVIILGKLALTEKAKDVVLRGVLAFLAAQLNYLLGQNFFAALYLAFGLFFFFFDYAVNVILAKPRPFAYTGKHSRFDNLSYWQDLHPVTRLLVKLAVVVSGLFIYFL